MTSKRWKGLPSTLLRVLTVFSILALIYAGPFAPSTSAQTLWPPKLEDVDECSPRWDTYEEERGELIITYRCEPHLVELPDGTTDWRDIWVVQGFRPKTRKASQYRMLNGTSPAYAATVQAAVGEGEGGGVATSTVAIFGSQGEVLRRKLGGRVIMRYQPSGSSSWFACHDTNWHDTIQTYHQMAMGVMQQTQPDCGSAYYEAKSAGRFFSTTLNQWVTMGGGNPWVLSGSLWIPCTDPSCL